MVDTFEGVIIFNEEFFSYGIYKKKKGKLMLQCQLCNTGYNRIYKIGNIHDNPELLEEK